MKPFTRRAALLLGLGILIACCTHPPTPPPLDDSIAGLYTGWIVFDSLSLEGGVLDSQPYNWTFTRDSFMYARVDSIPDSVPYLFADCFGTYKVTDGLLLAPGCSPLWDQRSTVTTVLGGTYVILLHTKTNLTFVQGGSSGKTVTVRLSAN